MYPKLIPVTQWNKFHAWPPLGGLRHLINNRETNGFSDVLVRPARNWLIDEAKFFEWMKSREYQHPLSKHAPKDSNAEVIQDNAASAD